MVTGGSPSCRGCLREVTFVNDGVNNIVTSREVKMPMSQQVLEQLGRRQIIFASPTTDVSDKLIVKMNNTHATAPASVGPAKK